MFAATKRVVCGQITTAVRNSKLNGVAIKCGDYLGIKDKKMAEELGIRMGDTITPYQEFRVLNDGVSLLGKAWEDRIAVAAV